MRDLGHVHRSCFIEWDRRQEALKVAGCVRFLLGDPGEYWVELEREDAPLPRAAWRARRRVRARCGAGPIAGGAAPPCG